MKNAIIFCLFVILSASSTYAGNNEKKLLKKARKELSLSNYEKAKEHYSQLLDLQPNDPDYLFETGITYYNSYNNKEKSLGYFEKCLSNSTTDTIAEVFYYLGRSNQYKGNYETAIKNYNDFKEFINNKNAGILLSKNVNRYIQECNNGLQYRETEDKDVIVKNLKEKINGSGAEYAPVISKDNKLLIYTGRKRESTGGKIWNDNQEYEDIYISVNKGEDFDWSSKIDSTDEFISKKINSKKHDAAIAYNSNEDKLYIYRENHIWISELNDGKWGEPKKMNSNINAGKHEPSIYVSADEKMMIVTSDRQGGEGGRDLWFTTKDDNGDWKDLENMGTVINSSFDEDAPFLLEDGKTMFFSSNGHSTMGGFDVFKTTFVNGKWTEPVNLGSPINTPGDDIYYIQDAEGILAYYSSDQAGGYGDMDIYSIQLQCRNIPNTEIKGLLVAGSSQLPIGGKMIVKNENNEVVGEYDIDPTTGQYIMVLPPEQTYKLEIKPNGDWFVGENHTEEFTLPKQCDPFPLYQEVSLKKLRDENNRLIAQKAEFSDVFFNIEDTVKALHGLSNKASISAMNNLPHDSIMFNIAGDLKFNDALSAEEGIEVYLLNKKNEVVRITRTDKEGKYSFRDIKNSDNYLLAINEEDLKDQYYGLNNSNGSNSILVQGDLMRIYNNNVKSAKRLDSVEVRLMKNDKTYSNLTNTDLNGHFILDNVTINNPEKITEANNNLLSYNLNDDDIGYLVSAYIKTLDSENNELFKETIHLIEYEYDTSGGSGGAGGNGGGDLAGINFENIYFDFDKYFLKSKSKSILDKIYDYMSENNSVTIKMDGHTDWIGTNKYNMSLSKKRSEAARKYLITKGIDVSRIEIAYFGESLPAKPNANPDGSDNKTNRQLNRRVEFKVKTPDMAFTFIN